MADSYFSTVTILNAGRGTARHHQRECIVTGIRNKFLLIGPVVAVMTIRVGDHDRVHSCHVQSVICYCGAWPTTAVRTYVTDDIHIGVVEAEPGLQTQQCGSGPGGIGQVCHLDHDTLTGLGPEVVGVRLTAESYRRRLGFT